MADVHVLVQPSAGFDVDLLVRRERLLEKLMLAYVDLPACFHVQRDDVPDSDATERNLAVSHRLGHEDLHTREHPFECARDGLDAAADRRTLPKQHVMLEVDRHAADVDRQNGNKLAVEV